MNKNFLITLVVFSVIFGFLYKFFGFEFVVLVALVSLCAKLLSLEM